MMGSYLGWSWLATRLKQIEKPAARHQAAKAPKTATRWKRPLSGGMLVSASTCQTPIHHRISAAHEAADRRAAGGKGRLAAAAAGAVEVLAA